MTGGHGRLVLIRHGEGVINRTGVLGGHGACLGLSDSGRAQAAALRDRLLGSGVLADADALFTSLLPRAIETAAVISPALRGGAVVPVRECELCDVHWGDLDGAPVTELPVDNNVFQPVARDGESWLVFERRCRRVVRRLAAESAGRTVVVVTHNGIIKSSLRTLGSAGSEADHQDVAFTSMTTWAEGLRDVWRLTAYDDHAHLPDPARLDVG
jgi:2,3-bisphosphoglycerate-dependent phosphoglycerate mutase